MNKKLKHDNHIVRYCSPWTVDNGIITAKAFEMRPKDRYLSVNWIERYSNIVIDAIKYIKDDLKRKNFVIKTTGKFAILNVGEMIIFVEQNTKDKRNLSVLKEPSKKDSSHAGIYGYNMNDNNLIPSLIRLKIKSILDI